MGAKDSITFDFSRFHIPPWAAADYEVVYLPFPKDAECIAHPLSEDYPFFKLPPVAFDESGENLICFQEKRLLGNEKVGTRPLPARTFTQSLLRPEAFAHIRLGDTSPESLCELMNSAGLIIAPLFGSQRLFIDSRFHHVVDEEFSYTKLHLLDLGIKDADAGILDLMQAAADIFDQYRVALGGSDIAEEPFENLCGGSLTEAVVLSEYARRVACRHKDPDAGGIVSYYEVLLTIRALFGAMADLIDFSIADGSMARFEELAKERAEKGKTRSIHNYALELLSTTDAAQRSNAVANVGGFVVREGFDFLQRCMMATTGAQWGRVIHQSTPAHELHDGIAVKAPAFLELQRSFYEKNEPRYLQDHYCEGSLSAALAAQFLATLADPAPWKRCDNPECGTYFKHHFTDKGRGNPKATSCSRKCSTRKRNRVYNLEASTVRTACRRYGSSAEAMAYIEERLAAEVELADLPRARRRWEKRCEQHFSNRDSLNQ